MSALTPHIRVLLVEGECLNEESKVLNDRSEATENVTAKSVYLTASLILGHQAKAKIDAARKLDEEEQAREEKLNPTRHFGGKP